MEEPGGLQSMGSLGVRHDWATSRSLFTSCIGEGNGNPLQCSCLENPRDRGAWWAALYGAAQSRTRLSDFHFSLSCFGEGNGNPLQSSCRENPRDGGAWWARSCRVGHDWSDLAAAAAAAAVFKKCFFAFFVFLMKYIDTFGNVHIGNRLITRDF